MKKVTIFKKRTNALIAVDTCSHDPALCRSPLKSKQQFRLYEY